MSDPRLIKEIVGSVTIPVMAKCRIGHFVEAQVQLELSLRSNIPTVEQKRLDVMLIFMFIPVYLCFFLKKIFFSTSHKFPNRFWSH